MNTVEAPASSPVVPSTAQPVRAEPGLQQRRVRSSLLDYPATYLLIGINVAVFLAMLPLGPLPQLLHTHAYGSLLTAEFDPDVLLRFGALRPLLVLGHGQWWRLITSTFVHVSLLHLLLNMWCLWNLGIFGEPLLGRPGLVAVYLLTGLAGMLQSLAFSVLDTLHSGPFALLSVVAGASGAIFGIAGILIVLLSNRKLALPWDELRSLRRQVIFFAVANLAIGLAPGALPAFSPQYLHAMHLSPDALPHIDNSAHIGGLLCGLALGWPLLPRMTSGRSSYRARQVWVFGIGALALVFLGHMLGSFARPLFGR